MKNSLFTITFLLVVFTGQAQTGLEITTGSVLFKGNSGNTPTSGPGVRMMWIPGKKAFRAGEANGTEWDDANIGLYSFSAGHTSKASGYISAAFGASTSAGFGSFAAGSSTANAVYSTTFGNAFSNGRYAFATGFTSALAYGGTAVGVYNDISDTPNGEAPVMTDRIFQIGNGQAPPHPNTYRSNAMTVLRNGNVGIGTLTPQYILDVNGQIRVQATLYSSDIRLKKGITPLANSLQAVSQLQGLHYYWKDGSTNTQLQTGFSAQHVKDIFPELVNEDENGYLSVNYIGLIPHMVEAVKQLKSENDLLKTQIQHLTIALKISE